MSEPILLVDDEAGIRKVLAISLRDKGYAVETAAEGAAALEIFDRQRPDIVLTDIKMPGMDGLALLQALKKRDPEAEVIMLTGHGDMSLAVKSLKLDATDFLTKPISDDALEVGLARAHERINIRRRLRRYTEDLERLVEEKSRRLVDAERMAAVGETVAGLAHAIKNIASGLKGGAFVLEEGLTTGNRECLQQGWELVRGNVEKITRLSLDLLDYTRSGEPRRQSCDPNRPAREVYELMRTHAVKEGVELVLEPLTDGEPILLDPDGIHRCLLNLVANALDACTETACRSRTKQIRICVEAPEAGGVAYRVADNCCGMAPEVRDRIFQQFFSTKGTRGTGIGLMLTRRIVDQHRGQVWVRSVEAQGSEFVIRLPAGTEPVGKNLSR